MGGDFGSHNDNAVGIYCAEAKETNESIVSATHKILPSKNAKRTPTEEKKTAGYSLWKAVKNEAGKVGTNVTLDIKCHANKCLNW